MSLTFESSILTRMPLFAKIEPSKLKLIAFAGERLPCTAGDELFHQGETADSVYVVLEGEVDILRETDNGQVPLARLGPGNLIGEIGVLCDQPRNATIVVSSEGSVLRIEGEVFVEFVNGLPALSMAIIQELSARLDAMNKQFAEASGS